MEQEAVFSSKQETDAALQDLFSQLKKDPSTYDVVIFYASSIYDFSELTEKITEHFPSSKVMGTSTTGEISPWGFTKNSIVLTTITDSASKFSGVLINDVDKFPIIYKNDIEKAAKEVGIHIGQTGGNKDAFAFTLINGLYSAEESVLALLNKVIGDNSFAIAGGTAADDLKFQQTYVAFDGKVASHGAAVLFVKTPKKFLIKRENIYKPTGRKAVITSADLENRIILTMDGKNARTRYAELLGVSEKEAPDYIFDHPIGRVFGSNIYVTGIVEISPDGTIPMYARVLPGTQIELLDPIDELESESRTCDEIKSEIPNPGVVLFVNCAFRTIEFERNKTIEQVSGIWKKAFPVHAGFSCYGEQKDKLHFNQTLVALVIES